MLKFIEADLTNSSDITEFVSEVKKEALPHLSRMEQLLDLRRMVGVVVAAGAKIEIKITYDDELVLPPTQY